MERVLTAVAEAIGTDAQECLRVFHGRGHCFTGLEFLTVDWFPSLVWVCLFSEPDSEWMNSFFSQLRLVAKTTQFNGTIQVQHRYLPSCPVDVIEGGAVDSLEAKEHGLKYKVKFGGQQNTGLFLDMASGREWVRSQAKNANILNLFAYTCAFSVAAIEGGARQVVNVDMAKGALNRGRENHRMNNHPMNKVKFFAHDVLRSWGKFKRYGPYDLILVDPPSYQKGSFVAQKDYIKIARRFPELLSDKGKVLACLNAPELDTAFLQKVMTDQGFRFIERIANPQGFPEKHAEKGLKVMLFEWRPSSVDHPFQKKLSSLE